MLLLVVVGVGDALQDEPLQHLLALRGVGRLVEAACLDDLGLLVELLVGRREDLLLYRRRRHQPQHAHLVLLADAVGARHRLQVHLRVPVRIEEDHLGW